MAQMLRANALIPTVWIVLIHVLFMYVKQAVRTAVSVFIITMPGAGYLRAYPKQV